MSARSRLGGVFRILAILFALLYLFALAVWAAGTFGLFGVEPEALSGVYLIALGAPWSTMIASGGVAAGVLAPLINLAILIALWRLLR